MHRDTEKAVRIMKFHIFVLFVVKDKKEWTESIEVNYIQKYLLVSAGVRYLNP